jgi:glycosyltransferase involved in cell wall biosynthesis
MVDPAPRLAVLGATHPLTGGAAQFNAAMVAAMRRVGKADFVSWKRLYPPLLYRGQAADPRSRPPRRVQAEFVLDWLDPRSWRAALRRVADFGAEAIVLPWLHPVMAPPYRWILKHAPPQMARVVICHNVLPHEPHPAARVLTKGTLRHADLLVTHAPQQRAELAELGLHETPVLEAFHPRFVAADLAAEPFPDEVAAERRRLGDPDLLLLCYGAIRPYKGVDLALEALTRVRSSVRLVVAGKFWSGKGELIRQAARLGDRVELRDGYVSNEETALLFSACDAALLTYRSASQSGVVALAFAHERPVVVTDVGGLRAAVRDDHDGFVVPSLRPALIAEAIERLAHEHLRLREGVREGQERYSFDRYASLIGVSVRGLR